MKKIITPLLISLLAFFSCLAFARDAKWAKPLNHTQLANFHQVSPVLYRGAQPTKEGFIKLKELGIKTILNLRFFNSDKKKLDGLDLQYFEVPMNASNVKEYQIAAALKIILNPSNQPVFIHCLHGSDRTGIIAASYRIIEQNWSKSDALDEFVNGGFGYHKIFANLIMRLKNLRIEKLKKELRY
jgi:protein tyrosine/serine phosphatase